MLVKDEYSKLEAKDGRTFILCQRVDMFDGIEKELLRGTTISYKCSLDKANCHEWLKLFEEATKTTFTTFTSKKGTFIIYKGYLRCHHNIPDRTCRPRQKDSPKNVDCPAKLTIVLRRGRTGPEAPDADYPMRVYSNQEPHNHRTDTASALKFRKVGAAARDRLLELAAHFHSPATALKTYKMELRAKHGDDYPLVSADRAILPDIDYVYSLYKAEYQRQNDGAAIGEELLEQLNAMETSGTAVACHDGETVIATVTPLMEHVNSLPISEEIVFLDSSGNMNGDGLHGTWTDRGTGEQGLGGTWTEGEPAVMESPDEGSTADTGDTDTARQDASDDDETDLLQRETRRHLSYLEDFVMQRVADPLDGPNWHRALGAMVTKFKSLSTADKLSALHSFGAPVRGRRFGTRAGVQPTSVARRTSTTTRGRGRARAGQPASRKTGEHQYAASSARRQAAQHSLNTCVGENESLGH